MRLVKYILLLSGILVLFKVEAQILTGPILGGQATLAGYSTQYDGVDFRQDFSINYFGGWSYSYDVNSSIAFYSELIYSRKGKVQHYNSISTRAVKHEAYSYFLEAPLLLRISRPIGRSKAKWFINLGPQVSYWLGGRGTMSAYEAFGSSTLTQIDYQVDFAESTAEGVLGVEEANRIQFGLAVGGGVGIPINRQGHQLVINLRYVSGTTFMASNESFEIGTTEIEEYMGYKHNVLQVSTAYVIPISLVGMRRGKSSNKIKHRR